jgi:1-acyl-sn-glycerol-3-phosphate acyltransferase
LTLYYRFCRDFVGLLAKIFVGFKAEGLEKIPATGSVILASNHVSNFDPPFIGSGVKREMHFLAKSELFGKWYSKVAIEPLNTIPVKRGRFDRESYARAHEVVGSGGMLLLFPEGTRSRDGKLREGKTGAAKLSIETNSPVMPLGIRNSNRLKGAFLRRCPVRLVVGDPISPDPYIGMQPEKDALTAYTTEIMARIGDLLTR